MPKVVVVRRCANSKHFGPFLYSLAPFSLCMPTFSNFASRLAIKGLSTPFSTLLRFREEHKGDRPHAGHLLDRLFAPLGLGLVLPLCLLTLLATLFDVRRAIAHPQPCKECRTRVSFFRSAPCRSLCSVPSPPHRAYRILFSFMLGELLVTASSGLCLRQEALPVSRTLIPLLYA